MKKHIWFIINPISGTHHSDDVEKVARVELDSTQFEPTFFRTEHKSHGAEIARRAVTEAVDIVVAVGGDGTINEVASQLVGTNTALVIVPHGSGNGLAYHLGLPMKLQQALQVIRNGRQVSVDVGQVNGRYFFSIAGIGFDAKVAFDFNRDKHRGFMSYFKHILVNYFTYKSGRYRIETEDKSLIDNAFFITFANSSQWGYNVKIAPMASLCDGKLDVCIVKRPKLFLKMLNCDLPRLLSAHFDRSNIVQYWHEPAVRIQPLDGTQIYLHIDGDAIGIVENIDLQVVPSALRLIVPENSEVKMKNK